jgi:hypothetical protein
MTDCGVPSGSTFHPLMFGISTTYSLPFSVHLTSASYRTYSTLVGITEIRSLCAVTALELCVDCGTHVEYSKRFLFQSAKYDSKN